MKEKSNTLRTSLLATLLLGALGLPLLAQQDQTLRIGKREIIRFSSEVRAGDVLLQPGSYQIQHVDHVVVFRKMLANYLGGFTRVGKEVARVDCEIETQGDKLERTEVLVHADPTGNRTITELRIKGENVRHVF